MALSLTDISEGKLQSMHTAQFEKLFALVERRDFACELAATEVQPVIDYLDSTAQEDDLTCEQIQLARENVSLAVVRDGAFRMRKSTDVLIAR